MKDDRRKSEEEKPDDYGIDLKRFTNHKKVFPWMFIIKAIVGLAMIAGAYYFSKELINKNKEHEINSKEQEGIEVEIQEN